MLIYAFGEDANSGPDSRMFYKANLVSSGRSSFLSRDAIELVPISGDVVNPQAEVYTPRATP